MSAGGAAHLPLLAAGRSRWACASAAAGDAYVRVVRAKAVRAPRVTAGGDGGRRCETRRAPPLPSPSPPPPPPAGLAGRPARARPRPPPPRAHAPWGTTPGPPRPDPGPPPRWASSAPSPWRRPYSCPRAHFADGETDAPNPQMPRARSVRARTQVCQKREPRLSPAYWKLFSPEESRGVQGEGFPCSKCLHSACCGDSRSNLSSILGFTWFRRRSSGSPAAAQ